MFYFIVVIALSILLSENTHASNECKVEVARFVSIQGTIEVRRVAQRQANDWQRVDMDTVICLGDMIRSRTHSRAALRLSNDSMLRLDQRSSMTFIPPEEEKKSFLMDLIEGAIHVITRTPKPFDVKTPFINATINGTEFLVGVDSDRGQVVVYEGKVTASNGYGSVVLNDREAATATPYQAPQKTINIRPIDAVHWALYYPTITSHWQSSLLSDTPRLLQQASDLLAVGQADEAQSMIQQVIQKQSDNNDAHALLAIIAVAQNDKEAARSHANQAIQLNAQSPVAYLALSYTQQAQFDIEAALVSVNKALELDARNALAWARLAELQMSTGETDRAIASAHRAVQLQPNLAKTQSVLGFAHLLQIDTDSAKEAFNQSIALDSADPMPRLGMGLALIREGQLEAGRIQLEIAASLDPANSLIRSYLGKAYFEEKRYPLASTQFDMAKQRDPKDPTPWLYDGIQKQTQNRPIEALQDIQKSIELNDNRAVYRSKFLLDRDEAARGSSLARIFETLGFERRAIMETAKSLSFDPANHSAHRFLSDTYANTPRHEIARVSELLQAQLLQPINVNPVQPHMAVADLNIITGTTPSAVSFNEFAPLMERNKPQIVTSGIVGSNGTLGNEVVASMQRDRASVSLGQFHYETNGFRTNNDQNHNVYNGFFQYALTPKLNIQTEFKRRETENGDLFLNFDRAKFNETIRNNLKENSVRVGMHYKFSLNQDFLFSGKYINRNLSRGTREDFDQMTLANSGFQLEAQHLFRGSKFNSVTGGNFYQFNYDSRLHGTRNPNIQNMDRENVYAYLNTNVLNNLIVTTGLSFDSFTSTTVDDRRKNKLNPKLGLQLNVSEIFRIRAAWFETTKSHIVAQQTLEPTQIAGFNQLFDDVDGTRSTRMGVGIDSIFSQTFLSGIEISKRNLQVPTGYLNNLFLETQKESLLRAYMYWLPNINWAIKGEVQYEVFRRNHSNLNIPIGEPVQIKNLIAPISLEYFSSIGIFSKFTTTFVSQNLTRNTDFIENVRTLRDPSITNSGFDSFFLLDTSAGYRFLNRRGILNFEARNLLDENFFYRNLNFAHNDSIAPPRFIYDRAFYLSLTVNF